jgi:arylsulfatase A-like enzyme
MMMTIRKRFSAALIACSVLTMVALAGGSFRMELARVSTEEVPLGLIERPPNVLIIVTDDQRKGTLGVMPHTKRLFRRQGVTFPNAYVSTPLCCPSRTSILTGQYAHNHGVRTNMQATSLDTNSIVPRYLADAGYENAIFGKFLNAWPLGWDPPHFDQWAVSRKFPYYGGQWSVDGQIGSESTYSTRFIADKGAKFIQQMDRTDDLKPWMLILGVAAPHGPAIPEKKYADAPVPGWSGNPAVFERDRSDKIPGIRRRGTGSFPDRVERRTAQLRTLLSVDDLVKKIFRTLEETGEARDTIAFFISDNGYSLGEHGLGGKTSPYSASVQIPLMVRWPGQITPGTDPRFAMNIDVAPTIMDAADLRIDPGRPMDGRSLLNGSARRSILLEYFHYNLFDSPSWASLRTRRYQYIEYYDEEDRIIFRELYLLKKDPWQLNNVLYGGDRPHKPKVSLLHRKLTEQRTCVGSNCP